MRNSSYRVSTGVSSNLASRDLKVLVDAKLLVSQGEKRGRVYTAGSNVFEIRQESRLPETIADPFGPTGPAQAFNDQGTLFPAKP